MTQIKEKKHRLPSGLYAGYVRVAVTAYIKNKLPVFVNSNVVDYFSDTLIFEATDNNCDTESFQIKNRILVFEKRFKKRVAENFYDHLIRNEEGVLKHIRYVLNNPVRRGIVADLFDYPYKGSTSLDLNKEIF
ncbi:hypothetical protein JNM05_03330 [bacterium]|nr:hypothetical protein [bacterium]